MSYKHASIVPLIGGETIAQENIFGTRPEYIMTYSVFKNNEQHLLNYYNNEVPYHVLDEGQEPPKQQIDVVNTVCPCAGLSSLSPSASSDNKMNDWMYESAEYVLGKIKPKVFWGENAPRLASKMGEPVVKRLRKIAEKNGYTMSIYKTKSILHGLSQVRDRTFYFFWQGESIPVFEYIVQEHEKIEETIRSVKRDPNDPMSVLTNNSVPSENPFYKYVLEEIEGGITHQEFSKMIPKTTNPLDYIESKGIKYKKVAEWMRENGYDREAAKADRMHHKLASGGNIMRKTTEIPKDFIGAFVGHMPTQLTHPDEDRYLTVREALTIMKMPKDYVLLEHKKSLNHICQNVPVTTAEHAARMVKKYLDGDLDTVVSKFAIQDNKGRTFKPEVDQPSLEEFM